MKSKKLPDIEIIEMYKLGLSSRNIAKKIGVSQYTILSRLKKNNVIRRNATETARKHYFNQEFFDKIDTEGKAYFLGFILADGSINNLRNSLKITISEKDEEILFNFCEEIGANPKTIKRGVPIGGYSIFSKIVTLDLSSKKLIEGLAKLGISSNKTFTVKCPEIQEDMKPHLWRGILEGDGWVSVSNIRDGYLPALECGICGNLFTMNDFSILLTSLNIKHTISKDKSIYRIRLNGERGLKFLNYVYKDSTIFLKRKRDNFNFYLKEKEKQAERKLSKN